MKGKLDHLVGTCPDVWFTVKGRLVHATFLTEYKHKDKTCDDLKNGRDVTVTGVPQLVVPLFLLAQSIDIK